MKRSGLNLSQLATALSIFKGSNIYRQQLQTWRNGAGISLENMRILEKFKKNAHKRRKQS